MAKLFFPDIPAIVAKPAILRHVTGDVRTLHWDVKVCFTGRYFCEFEQQARRARGEALDALDWMAKEFGLPVFPQQLSFAVTHRLDELEHVVDAKSEEFCIDWKKTILVCPGSFSCGVLSAEDMALIQRMAKERGLFVIVNCDTGKNRLSMPELLSKARHAAGIIGIRSGLMDLLVMAKVPMLVFYRDFPDRGFNTPACPAESVLRMFSLRRKENKDFVTESILNPAVGSEIVRDWMNHLNGKCDHEDII